MNIFYCSFIIDDDGNVSDYESSSTQAVKLESSRSDLNENSNDEILTDNSIVAHLDDPTQLGNYLSTTTRYNTIAILLLLEIITGLPDFEDSLMQELDSDLMNIDADPEANCIMQHMDIRDPLSKLKKLLEQRLGVELPGYLFCLQGTQMVQLTN